MRLSAMSLFVAPLALAACGSEPSDPPEPGTTDGEEAQAELTGFASAYTELDLDSCDLTSSQSEEGESASWNCEGFGGMPLFVFVGDGRFDIDVGVESDSFDTIGAFNEIDETIEWRLKDGAPFAVIFRYRDVSMEANGRTVLSVEKVGSRGIPGCRVAFVGGETPDANQVARDIADTSAAEFVCGTDEVARVGNAS